MLRRIVLAVATAAVLGSIVTAVPAVAQEGGGDCSAAGSRGKCWVGASGPGMPGKSGPGGTAGSVGNTQTGGGGGGSAPKCTYTPVDDWYAAESGSEFWQGHKPSEGKMMIRRCEGDVGDRPAVVFVPNGANPAAGPPPPSPAELAERAIRRMGLLGPDIGLAPSEDSKYGATIGFPVWMWTERSEARSGPVTRSASAAGITVTATASLARIDWQMGDGSTVTCNGPGTPFTEDQAGEPSPTCGHVYRALSDSGKYRVEATSTWQIRWSGGGQSDSQTLTLGPSTTDLPVREVRTLNKRPGS